LKRYLEGIEPPAPANPDPLTVDLRGPIRHYPRVVSVPSVGEIPVNIEAIQYKESLANAADRERKKNSEIEAAIAARTRRAAAHCKCCKMKRDLQDDLCGIYHYEVAEQLKPENLRKPAVAVPMCSTYLVDENYMKRNEKITRYLCTADAPKPRKQAPEPMSLHPTSPVATDDDS
jgi:hypothetical protein